MRSLNMTCTAARCCALTRFPATNINRTMSEKPFRDKSALKALHKVEEGRVRKAQKSRDSAATGKIKAVSWANPLRTYSSESPLQPKHKETQTLGYVPKGPRYGSFKTKSSSIQSSIKQSRPLENVIHSERHWHPSKLPPNTTSLRFAKGLQPFDVRE